MSPVPIVKIWGKTWEELGFILSCYDEEKVNLKTVFLKSKRGVRFGRSGKKVCYPIFEDHIVTRDLKKMSMYFHENL